MIWSGAETMVSTAYYQSLAAKEALNKLALILKPKASISRTGY